MGTLTAHGTSSLATKNTGTLPFHFPTLPKRKCMAIRTVEDLKKAKAAKQKKLF